MLYCCVLLLLLPGSGDAAVAPDDELVGKQPEPLSVSDTAAAAAAAAAADDDDDDDDETSSSQSAGAAGEHAASSSSSVAVGLSSGQFDVVNVRLLRTCSEPDLSRLCHSAAVVTSSHRKSVVPADSCEDRRLTTGSQSNDFSPHAVSCSSLHCTTLQYTYSHCTTSY